MPNLKQMAIAIVRGYSYGSYDADDLVQAGAIAAVKAAPRWRADGGASRKTYLLTRARGGMLDEMRVLDFVPRYYRAQATRGCYVPRELQQAADTGPDSLDRDAGSEAPVDASARADLWRRAEQLLPERERRIMRLYFRNDLTLKEIGKRIGLSEGRVCQLYKVAIKWLRRRMPPEEALA